MSEPLDFAAICARNEERKNDPAVHYQYGCAGTHHGIGTEDCPRERHHHHDDRCAPPVTVDIDVLLAEVERLKDLVFRHHDTQYTRLLGGQDCWVCSPNEAPLKPR